MIAFNQDDVKLRNRNLVLRLIISSVSTSRADVARLIGLTKMTISNITNELLADDIVKEIGTTSTGIGRPAVELDISDNCGLILGLYISRRALHGCISTLKGKLLSQKIIQLSSMDTVDNTSLIENIYNILDEMHDKAPSKVLAIGISSVGPLDPANGILLSPPRFGGVSYIPLNALLNRRYSLPVFLENDMNTSALAEKFYGSAVKDHNFIFFGVSDGVGAGIYVNDSLYHGSHGQSGEIGHVSIDLNGPRCSCGNRGCLELYASTPANFSAQTPDEQRALLRKNCPYLATACLSLINLFDPDKIFLGQDLSIQGEFTAELIREEIAGKHLDFGIKTPEIVPSALGMYSPVIGTAALCVENLFPI